MWKWFRKQNAESPMEARLPGQGLSRQTTRGQLDLLSPTWVFISDYATSEIAALRQANDRPMDADRTAAIRGQIKALKKLLELKPGREAAPKSTPADIFAGEEDY